MSDPSRGFQFQNSHSESEPLNSLPASLLVDGSKRPIDSMEGSRVVPTAPAFDDSADEAFTSGHCHHHHPHHRLHHPGHHHHHPGSHSSGYSHPSDLPGAPGTTGSYNSADPSSGSYKRQGSVVSAPGGMYSRPENPMCGGMPGGCGYMRQESAPCGPVAPCYTPHPHIPEVGEEGMPLNPPPPPADPAGMGVGTGGLAEGGEVMGATAGVPPPPSAGQVQPHMAGQPSHMAGQPSHMAGQPSHMAGQPPHFGGVHISVNGPRGAPCPSCSTSVCAPPTYDESLQHQVLHQ